MNPSLEPRSSVQDFKKWNKNICQKKTVDRRPGFKAK